MTLVGSTIGKKAFRLIVVVLVVSAITFLMVNSLPGDVAYVIGGEDASLDDIRAIRKELGLDRNMAVRYFIWMGNVITGDFGKSYLTDEPVFEAIVSRLPVTIELIVISQVIALLLAIPTGIISAYRSDTVMDRLISSTGFATLSIPSFVMSLVTIYFFSIQLRWLPATGYIPISEGIRANLKSFLLPSLSIALIEWVVLMRVLRSDMIMTLQEDYILLAKSQGLPTHRILLRHALRPSSFTLLTLFGLQVGHLIGGALIIEIVFALPGIGRLMIEAIFSQDSTIIQGCVLFITTGYLLINFLVDLGYSLLDPRIRREKSNG